jgi:hypothetical protein
MFYKINFHPVFSEIVVVKKLKWFSQIKGTTKLGDNQFLIR